ELRSRSDMTRTDLPEQPIGAGHRRQKPKQAGLDCPPYSAHRNQRPFRRTNRRCRLSPQRQVEWAMAVFPKAAADTVYDYRSEFASDIDSACGWHPFGS